MLRLQTACTTAHRKPRSRIAVCVHNARIDHIPFWKNVEFLVLLIALLIAFSLWLHMLAIDENIDRPWFTIIWTCYWIIFVCFLFRLVLALFVKIVIVNAKCFVYSLFFKAVRCLNESEFITPNAGKAILMWYNACKPIILVVDCLHFFCWFRRIAAPFSFKVAYTGSRNTHSMPTIDMQKRNSIMNKKHFHCKICHVSIRRWQGRAQKKKMLVIKAKHG